MKLLIDTMAGGMSCARFDYGYDSVNRRTFEQRDSAKGDVFGYDAVDQVTGVNYDATNPTSGGEKGDRHGTGMGQARGQEWQIRGEFQERRVPVPFICPAHSGLGVKVVGSDLRTYVVFEVASESAGAKAGFKIGDVLTEFDHASLESLKMNDVRMLFRGFGRHQVLVIRDGKPISLNLELDDPLK